MNQEEGNATGIINEKKHACMCAGKKKRHFNMKAKSAAWMSDNCLDSRDLSVTELFLLFFLLLLYFLSDMTWCWKAPRDPHQKMNRWMEEKKGTFPSLFFLLKNLHLLNKMTLFFFPSSNDRLNLWKMFMQWSLKLLLVKHWCCDWQAKTLRNAASRHLWPLAKSPSPPAKGCLSTPLEWPGRRRGARMGEGVVRGALRPVVDTGYTCTCSWLMLVC